MPLHRAIVFKATRSPKSSCLALPRTMATLVLVPGGTYDPSGINHSTLASARPPRYPPAVDLLENLVEERHTSKHALRSARPASTHLALSPEERLLLFLAYDKASPVKRRSIFRKPSCDISLPRRRQEMRKVLSWGESCIVRHGCSAHRTPFGLDRARLGSDHVVGGHPHEDETGMPCYYYLSLL